MLSICPLLDIATQHTTWMSWMVTEDLPTPPAPTTTILYVGMSIEVFFDMFRPLKTLSPYVNTDILCQSRLSIDTSGILQC